MSLVGDDLGQSGFDRPDDAVQVDVDHTFVGVEVGGGEGRGRVVGDPGVGEYNVYFAEVLLVAWIASVICSRLVTSAA